MTRLIEVLDTTLRDGAQGEGVSFSREDKIKIVHALDALGVDYIEAGNPAASPRDAALFAELARQSGPAHATLVAFGATCRAGANADNDPGLRALIESEAPVISLFGKSWRFHVDEVLKVSVEENLRMIGDSVAYLVKCGRRVFFDAEHFFDGYATDPDYAMATLRAAADAGAERLVLCDTNGGGLSGEFGRITAEVCAQFDLPVAIHCHNDLGLATAGTLEAVQHGADQVQGTLGGFGERCGNADLCQIIPNLVFKMGFQCLPDDNLRALASSARYIAEVANTSVPANAPFVGRSAFAHKGGMHIDGMVKNRRTFEHIDPESVGNRSRYLISEMAGRGALATRLAALAPDLRKDSAETGDLVVMFKALEGEGYTFEDADGSLELRILGALNRRERFFEVLDFHVISRKPDDARNSQAYVKIQVGNEVEITAEEGNGPVNALDLAIRKALTRFYPALKATRLQDFKVRVVGGSGTASRVRVHIESTDGTNSWATVGVSENVIEASFIALTDSIEYMLMNEKRKNGEG